MGGKKRIKKKILEKDMTEASTFSNYSVPARNLRKQDLGAVIFGCKHSTINECLSNNLFGLPATHFSYIKNIKEGLLLFLFNYSDRKLHGIFEAASNGQMNIDRYAWVADTDDYEYTSYPAQVRVRVRQQCQPLSENQFGPAISDNYYENQHFYFELDHNQTKKLMSLFTKCNVSSSSFPNRQTNNSKNLNQISGVSYASVLGGNNTTTGTWSSLFKTESNFEKEDESYKVVAKSHDDEEVDEWGDVKAYEDKSNPTHADTWESDWNSEPNTIKEELNNQDHIDNNELLNRVEENEVIETTNINTEELPISSSQPLDEDPNRQVSSSVIPDTTLAISSSTTLESLVVKLMKEVELLKGFHSKQITDINLLEQELDKSKLEIEQLRNRIEVLETGSRSVVVDPTEVNSDNHSKISNSVFIFGGYDGSSWLQSLDSYFPSYDIRLSLSPMNFVKQYASSATMNGEIYHFGRTVESFSPITNQWVLRPPSYWNNIHVAGASINNKLFVVGGNKDRHFSSEVEYLDLNNGKWLPIHSMNSKRSAPAAAEINNALYVSGGFDGQSYSSSVERLDPREEKWSELSDMNKRKGCHSMVVLNEKLYTLGGFDGEKYVQTVECYDTRMGTWLECEPMNVCRAYFGAFVLGEKLYAIGGVKENNEVLDIVECYKEGGCWEISHAKAIGKRSHFSAVVL